MTLKTGVINVLQMKLDEIKCKARDFWTQSQDVYSKMLVHQLEECKDLSVVLP